MSRVSALPEISTQGTCIVPGDQSQDYILGWATKGKDNFSEKQESKPAHKNEDLIL